MTTSAKSLYISIDGIKINKVLHDGIPLPNMYLKTATLNYIYDIEDIGQKLIDKIHYEESKEAHNFKIEILDEAVTWEYDARITFYELKSKPFLNCIVNLELCGKFKFSRGYENPVTVIRDFSK